MLVRGYTTRGTKGMTNKILKYASKPRMNLIDIIGVWITCEIIFAMSGAAVATHTILAFTMVFILVVATLSLALEKKHHN